MIYDIVNPSDDVTLETDDLDVASATGARIAMNELIEYTEPMRVWSWGRLITLHWTATLALAPGPSPLVVKKTRKGCQ